MSIDYSDCDLAVPTFGHGTGGRRGAGRRPVGGGRSVLGPDARIERGTGTGPPSGHGSLPIDEATGAARPAPRPPRGPRARRAGTRHDRPGGRRGGDREDRLLRAFAAQVAATARVLQGSCEDLLTPRTLGPFRDMARDAGGTLGKLGGDDRDAFIDALLDEMSFRQRPAVVIVEDAHWADNASLDIIRYPARRIERLPAMLVISYRDQELADEHPLRRIIGALAGPAVLRMELGGLSDAAVAKLATEVGLAPGPVVAAVGGNPFYLTEVLAAPTATIPPSVRHAVMARFTSLPPSCRSALERLAVIPHDAESWLVDDLVDDPTVLEPAERRAMLVSSQGRTRFRHQLARRVVELSLPSARRIDHHAKVLASLVAARAEPSRLVHHAVAAGDEDAVARYAAAAAAEAAEAEGHREAAAFARL